MQKLDVKINRYVQDGLRWAKDEYTVRSGAMIRVTNSAPLEGPHTFTVVDEDDLPKTVKQLLNCRICEQFGKLHGFSPEGNAPPQHLFVENGTGTDTPPDVDQPGDSGFTGEKKGNHIDLRVTAARGTELYFMCLLHPWMQAEVVVR